MFLKSLTLKGFKSFADTTTLEFEPGITVVVGPNGSGKSNIVDAVAWVLGAQGPRTLRSAKMEDVIFAGTPKRSALGRAEVSLTIDNSAGLLPIEFAEVTLSRTLWRSGESEYAINGVPCRLLDVQELLSDSGVGRQQHVIVSQGQLDAVLNAQPTERRLIIEEAAGVLKFRRRREKAQRRLEATEGNLLRVQDLLREVRRQLRPLERQAEAARRHGDVVQELGAIRLHLAGRELSALQSRAHNLARVKAETASAESQVVASLGRLDAGVLAVEAALTAAGDAGLGDVLGRFEGQRERARGLVALLAERRRSADRLRHAELDQDVVATLEADLASAQVELADVEAESERLAPQVADLVGAEAELAAELESVSAAPEPVGTGAAEVRGELVALRSSVERSRVERAQLDERLSQLGSGSGRLSAEVERLRGELVEAEADEGALADALDRAGAARASAEAELAAATTASADAGGAQRSWVARAEALTQALDEARARAGAQRLAGIEGMIGTLLDVVEIDPGWEAAVEAAVGEAIAAVVVEGEEAARRALAHLHDGGVSGAVLALGPSDGGGLALAAGGGVVDRAALAGGGGPVDGPALAAGGGVVDGPGERVREHVSATRPGVSALLDRLLSPAVAVTGGWQQALDVAAARPDLVVVTRDGDRFSSAGWRAGAGSAGATGAALEEARSQAAAATDRATAATAAVQRTQLRLETLRAAEAEAARALDRHDSRMAGMTEARQKAVADLRQAAAELDAVMSQAGSLDDRLATDVARIRELEELLPALEAEEAAGVERSVAVRAARARLDQRQATLRTSRTELEVRAGRLEQRRAILARRQDEVESRLRGHRSERDGAAQRRLEAQRDSLALARLADGTAALLERIEVRLGELREQRRAQATQVTTLSERLDGLRRERAVAERELTALRERVQRAELDDAEVRVRMETATETLRREHDCEPEVAMAATCPDLPAATTAEHRARELERDLRLMGPINPLAVEEHAALQERHVFLEQQLEDVKGGRRELAKVIRVIDAEIIEVFSAAFVDVADNFTQLFGTLFPGGVGRIRLTDPDNLLETGIEIEARPSGKNVKRLSLLSGGERSLTAMAFLFAVFRSRPSPFYLMDEVEAALDDINLHRFLDLIREFRSEAQLLIVSHQKRTMEAADCLYGVTMQSAGSSRVLSERVSAGA